MACCGSWAEIALDEQIRIAAETFIDRASAKYDGKDGQPGYECFGGAGDGVAEDASSMLGGWAPGVRARFLPDGIAMKLTKGSRIVLQVHYFANGKKDQTDQTKIGLYYSKNEQNKQLVYIPIVNTSFKIKPGDENAQVTAQFPIPPFYDATAIQVMPHMHLLGRQIKVEKIGADNPQRCRVVRLTRASRTLGYFRHREKTTAQRDDAPRRPPPELRARSGAGRGTRRDRGPGGGLAGSPRPRTCGRPPPRSGRRTRSH